jgi:hypothetical protein
MKKVILSITISLFFNFHQLEAQHQVGDIVQIIEMSFAGTDIDSVYNHSTSIFPDSIGNVLKDKFPLIVGRYKSELLFNETSKTKTYTIKQRVVLKKSTEQDAEFYFGLRGLCFVGNYVPMKSVSLRTEALANITDGLSKFETYYKTSCRTSLYSMSSEQIGSSKNKMMFLLDAAVVAKRL